MKKLLIALALTLAAIVLLLLLFIPAVVAGLVNLIRYGNRIQRVTDLLNGVAYSLDVFGNVAYADLLNALFAKGGYLHGNPKESVSSALGKRWTQGLNTRIGEGLVGFLNAIDPWHCWKSIEGNWNWAKRPDPVPPALTVAFTTLTALLLWIVCLIIF